MGIIMKNSLKYAIFEKNCFLRMPVKKEFTKVLDKFGLERIRVKLTIEKGKLTDIVFQYESFINEKWTEIVRYDFAHGFFHRDFIAPKGENEKVRIEINDMTMAATFAEQDIIDKWEFYQAKYLQKLKSNDKKRNNKKKY